MFERFLLNLKNVLTMVNSKDNGNPYLHHLTISQHDPLTGLVNRNLMEERITHAIQNAVCNGESIGILYCDLNEFKQINDDFGHVIGDRVLQEIAKSIQEFFCESDTIARWGGDEFLILVEHLDSKIALNEMANQLSKRIAFTTTEHQLSVSASIGVASFPNDGMSKEQLIELSDAKIYQNKQRYYGFS